jgi:hypothetical protein
MIMNDELENVEESNTDLRKGISPAFFQRNRVKPQNSSVKMSTSRPVFEPRTS